MNYKKLLLFLGFLFVIQTTTYFFFSGSAVHPVLLANQELHVAGQEDYITLIFSEGNGKSDKHKNTLLQPNDTLHYLNFYENFYQKVEIITSMKYYDKLIYRPGYINCNIKFTFFFPGYCEIGEYVTTYRNDELYLETWDSQYIWILFKWFKLERNNTGIS